MSMFSYFSTCSTEVFSHYPFCIRVHYIRLWIGFVLLSSSRYGVLLLLDPWYLETQKLDILDLEWDVDPGVAPSWWILDVRAPLIHYFTCVIIIAYLLDVMVF